MTKTLLIDATYPDDSPRALGEVIVTLIAGEAGGVVAGRVVLDATVVRLDEDGHGEIELATNDVEVEEPEGSFYRCTVKNSSPTITRSIRLTDDLADEVSWTDEAIQVVSPVPPTFVQLRVNGGGGTPGPTHTVALFATDVDMSGGSWTDLPVYGGGTVPRGYLTGIPVLVVDGGDFGLWTITASGPCTAGAALAPGVTIGCLAGGVGWWATAASNDGSTVAGITVAATTGQFDDVHDAVVSVQEQADSLTAVSETQGATLDALENRIGALDVTADAEAVSGDLRDHATTATPPTAWAVVGEEYRSTPGETCYFACPVTIEPPTSTLEVRATARFRSLKADSPFAELWSEPKDAAGIPGAGGVWDRFELAFWTRDRIWCFWEYTEASGTIEQWLSGTTENPEAVLDPVYGSSGAALPANTWVTVAVVMDMAAGTTTIRVRTDTTWDYEAGDGTRWRTLRVYTTDAEVTSLAASDNVEQWIGRGGGKFDVARVQVWCDGTPAMDFDPSTALDAATTVTDAVLLDEFDAPAVWTAHDNAAIHNP